MRTLINMKAIAAARIFALLLLMGSAACSGGTLKSLFDDAPAATAPNNPAVPTAAVTYAQGAVTTGPFVAGDVVITVTYPSNVTSVPNISINQPGSTDISAVAMTGTAPTNVFTYTYTVNAATGGTYIDGTATVSLSSVSLASGETVSAVSGNTFQINTVGPVVTGVSATNADATYGISSNIDVTVTFDKAVYVTGTPQLTLSTTSPATTAANYVSGSGTSTLTFRYTVSAGNANTDLDYAATGSLGLNGGTIRDTPSALIGNNANLTLPAVGGASSLAGSKAIVIDGVRPTVTNVTASTANGTYGIGAVISVQVTFSEAVNVTGTPNLVLTTGSPATTAVGYTSGSGTNTLTFDYTVANGNDSNDLDYFATTALTVAGGTIKDTIGNNPNDATLTLAAPAAASSLGANKAIVIKGVAPTVTNVTSALANGTYGVGAAPIDVTVTFSKAVTVSGFPTLDLAIPSATPVAYFSGSPGTTLTFRYTVAAGENTLDLDYAATTSLKLNGGTIKDSSVVFTSNANDATLTLASPGAAGSLGNNKAIIIDAAAPTVSYVTSTTANGSYKTGQAVNVGVVFNKAMAVTGTPQITLTTGNPATTVVNYVGLGTTSIANDTLNFTYTVAANNTSSDLDYASTGALALNGGTIKDTLGNIAALTLAAPGAANSLGANKAIVIDTTAPTVTSVTSSTTDGTYGTGSNISIQVVFSEVVNVVGSPTLQLETGTTDRNATYASGSGSNTLNFTYTVQAGDSAADLEYLSTASLTAGTTIRDAALNDATLTLPALGSGTSLGGSKAIVINTTVPAVTNVTSSTANGTYKNGSPNVSIQVTFSVAVDITGSPTLALNSGGSATCAAATNTTTMTCTYVIGASDNAADLDYSATTSLALAGGTINANIGGSAANLTLFTPGAAGSLGANKAIVIDNTAPTVTSVTSSLADGTYKAGQVVPIQVVFSEIVNVNTGGGTPYIRLVTGTPATTDVSYASGTGTTTLVFNYTIAAGNTSADLDYSATTALGLLGGIIQDTAGNNATLTLAAPAAANSLGANKALVIDTTAPTVTGVTSTTANGTYGVGTVIPIQVVFSEVVNVLGTPTLTLSTGSPATTALNYSSGSGTNTLVFNYTVAVNNSANFLDYANTTALTAGTSIKDNAGNDATLTLASPSAAGSLGVNRNIVIDAVAPVVTGVSSSTVNGSYKAGATVNVDVTFNKAITVDTTGGIPYITMATGTPATTNMNYSSGSGTATLTFVYTVVAGNTSADLDYASTTALQANGGTLKDTYGNNATLTLASPGAVNSLGANKNIIIDTTNATVTNVTSSTANGTYGVGSAVNVTVTFSEVVYVTGTPTITLATAGSANGTASYVSGHGTSNLLFTYTVGAGEVSSDLDYVGTGALAGTIRDLAQNSANLTLPSPGAAGSIGANKAIIIEGVVPTVTNITSSTANGSYKAGDAISIQVTFSEAVNVVGTPTLTLSTGTPATTAVNYVSGTGTSTLTFTYTVSAGNSSADLDFASTTALTAGSTIRDAALNDAVLTLPAPGAAGSLGSNKAIIVDTTAPTVSSVTASTADGTYGAGSNISIQVVFSEIVNVVGSPTLQLETGTTDRNATYASGSGSNTLNFTYTVQAGDSAADLEYLATSSLAAGTTIRDAALNDATLTLPALGSGSSLGGSKAIVINTTVPAVTNIASTTANGSYSTGNINVRLTFSVAVDVTGSPTIALNSGGSATCAAVTNSTTVDCTYTIAAGHNAADLDYSSTSALALSGGTINANAGGSAANLTLFTPGAAGSLGANQAIIVDTTAPTVTNVTSSLADGTYGAGQVVPIQVTFSEVVNVVGTPTLTLTTGTPATTAVNYASGTGTATLTFNYTVAAGNTSADLDYASTAALTAGTTIRDAALNNATLTLASPGAATSIGANKAIVISTAALNVQFSSTSATVAENAGTVNLPLVLSAASGSNVTVDYCVDATSTAVSADHSLTGACNTAAGTATITAGQTTVNIPVTITNDSMYEATETLVVKLVNPTNATVGASSTYTLSVTDDDALPTVSFAAATSQTVDESASAQSVAVTLSAPTGTGVTLTVALGSGTGTSGADFTTSGLSVSFPACNAAQASCTTTQVTQNVTYTPIQDGTIEGNETVVLNLGTPTNATFGAITTHTGTITDDDGTPQLSISNVTLTEGNAGQANATVTVTLAGSNATQNITVNYATSNGTASGAAACAAGIDFVQASGTLTWTPTQTGAQTFTVPVCGDTIAELNETAVLTISGATNANITTATANLTITNDDTSLIISSAQTLDCDPVDGLLDHYKITFNKAVTDSTAAGYVLNAKGSTTSTWGVAGRTNLQLDHGTALNSKCGTDTANDTVIYLKFTPGASVDTGVMPELTATAETISAVDLSGQLYYNTGNVITTDVSETDLAAPYVWYALATNVGGVNGAAGTTDTLKVIYSERTNGVSLTGVDLDTIFNLNNSHNFGATTDITSAVWSTTTYTNDTLTVTFATNNATVYDGDQIKAQGTTIQDTTGNSPAAIANVLTPPTITGTFDSGPVGPVVQAAEYFDVDSNGHIDHVKITFDKAMNDGTFPGFLSVNSNSNNTTVAWQVAGYSGVKIDTRTTIGSFSNPADDNVIWLTFTEGASYDTGAKPDLTATLGSAALKDNVNACYINATPTANCSNSTVAVLTTTQVSEGDKAPPIFTSATARIGARYVFVFFSENVWGASGTPACGAGGEVKTANFSYNNAAAGGATSITGVDSTDSCATTDGFARLFADTNFVTGDIGTDKIGAAASQLYDAGNNAMATTPQATIQGTVAPYVVAASSFFNSTTSKFYIRIVFSEPMSATTATNANNYSLAEDVATSCSDIAPVPSSVTAISSTVFDVETGTQCGTGATNPTTYRITASTNITDLNEIDPIGSPTYATTIGTNGTGTPGSTTDLTPPRLLQALALTSTTVQLTYSEPMKSGDVLGSAQCVSTYTTAATCAADIDATPGGTQLKYTFTPTLGNVESVATTAFNSVYVITTQNQQGGGFYAVTAYASNNVADIPEDLAGINLAGAPSNQTTFQGMGTPIVNFGDGSLFTDPFADGTSFSYAFSYSNLIYLGPNTANAGAFRFEADGANPIGVTFLGSGASCTNDTTFGTSGGTVCGTSLGPNGETGIVGFTSNTVTISSTNYELLMLGPIKDNITKFYWTQDVDTQLGFSYCSASFTGTNGVNSKSAQGLYSFNADTYVGISSAHNTNAPILNKFPMTASGGIVSCSGTVTDLQGNNITLLGKQGSPASNPAVNGTVIGIDSMLYVSSGVATNAFFAANNGGVVASTGSPTAASSFSSVITQANFGGTTLTYPAATGLQKIRPGQKGMPFMVVYNGALYAARNLAAGTSAANQEINNGGELWKCSSSCTSSGNWSKILTISSFATGGGGTNNAAISMLQVNGDRLYLGVGNATNGVGIFRTASLASPTAATDFTQQSTYGVGNASVYKYIFSSASKSKQGKNYIYVTVGDGTGAIQVVRQMD